jgi:hypothetical protein
LLFAGSGAVWKPRGLLLPRGRSDDRPQVVSFKHATKLFACHEEQST